MIYPKSCGLDPDTTISKAKLSLNRIADSSSKPVKLRATSTEKATAMDPSPTNLITMHSRLVDRIFVLGK